MSVFNLTPDSPPSALICAFDITKEGAGIALSWADLAQDPPEHRWRWIHLDRTEDATEEWLRTKAHLPEVVIEALLAEETRPRASAFSTGHIVILRGINFNPGAAREDMVSIRLWIEEHRIISLRRYKLLAVQDIRSALLEGEGPATIGDFLASLSMALADHIAPLLGELEDTLDGLEEASIGVPTLEEREQLIRLRRQIIQLRRFLSPQRDALLQMSTLKHKSFLPEAQTHLREAYDHALRFMESLDALRERSSLLHEEFANRLADRSNRNTYILTIVAAIFLPLGLLTGLLGVNVGGVPWGSNPWGFWLITGGCVFIGLLEFALLRYLRWI